MMIAGLVFFVLSVLGPASASDAYITYPWEQERFLRGGPKCLKCDCFKCKEVKEDGEKIIVTVGHCKEGSISWMCCVGYDGGVGNCDVSSCPSGNAVEAKGKCNTIPEGDGLTFTIPADAKTFTIATHDGLSIGNVKPYNTEACGGNGSQGGSAKCTGESDVGNANCQIDFDLEENCGYTPKPPSPTPLPPSPEPGPSPKPTDGPEPTKAPAPEPSPDKPTAGPEPTKAPAPGPTHKPSKSPTRKPSIAPTPPHITGDPHITKFNGDTYDFHGGCDLVLLHNPDFNNGQGLHVHVRTKITRWWSSIESAAVRIGDDVLEVKAGMQTRPYWFNGEEGKFMTSQSFPFTVGGFPGRYRYITDKVLQYKIFLDDGQAILIKCVKDMLRVELDEGLKRDFGKCLGLMGSFGDGLLLGRDGVTEFEDTNAFGQHWQVQDTDPQLFHKPEGPQYPEKCEMPTVDKVGDSVARRNLAESVSRQAAEKACAGVDKGDFKNCVFDCMAMGDLTAAEAF